MPDLLSFLPLFSETIDTLRARVDADANAGLGPDDPGYIDTTPGGFYWDMTHAVLLELERLWDVASIDLPASMFVGYTWSGYLDEHGAVLGVPRRDAVAATGEVTFTGDEGTLIPTATHVATTQIDPDADGVEFITTESGTIPQGGTLTLAVESTEPGSAGSVAAAAVNLLISPISGVDSVANAAAITGGADVESDEAYRRRIMLEYQRAQGGGSVGDYERWALAYPGVGFVKVVPIWAGPGTVRVVVTDIANNPVSDSVLEGLQAQLDPIAAATTLSGETTLPSATINVGSAADFAANGSIVIAGGKVVQYTGKTSNSFTGCTGGTGTIAAGASVDQRGVGGGKAPISAIVLIATPSTVVVDVAATVTFMSGYSLDGEGGTVSTRSELEAAVTAYLNSLSPGDDLIQHSAIAQFFFFPGVLDVTSLTFDRGGGAVDGNVAITDDEVASAGMVTLT